MKGGKARGQGHVSSAEQHDCSHFADKHMEGGEAVGQGDPASLLEFALARLSPLPLASNPEPFFPICTVSFIHFVLPGEARKVGSSSSHSVGHLKRKHHSYLGSETLENQSLSNFVKKSLIALPSEKSRSQLSRFGHLRPGSSQVSWEKDRCVARSQARHI